MCLELTGLGHRFAGRRFLFRGLDARLELGRLVAVVGPSGSGKSTLLSICAGYIEPTEGSVSAAAGTTRASWIPQNPVGVARRTARDCVGLPLLVRGATRRESDASADQLLERFGLEGLGGRLFCELSGGEAQRLMLARAVAQGRQVLLVDEPTAQLDAYNAQTVVEVLANLRESQRLVVVATHDDRVVGRCDEQIDLFHYADLAG